MAFDQERTGTWHIYGKSAAGNPGTTPSFIDRLAARFPEVAESIEADDLGIPSHEVDALKLATREAIRKGDWATVSAHLGFIDELLQSAEPSMHDAIGISYLIGLFYGETSAEFAKARSLMPKRLAVALELMERHYEELR
jgi:hypothetical protein